MPNQPLPYPGYSWSLSQHGGRAFEAQVLYELLQAAFIYANDDNYADRITAYLVNSGVLPPNEREDVGGRAQIWRDYQQVLSELGLIISARRGKNQGVVVTPIGLMWLDGSIGYSELITTQALRYQYPNGHKQDVSPRVKTQLAGTGNVIPSTRVELDVNSGVLMKPAVLLLRVLLEMVRLGDANPTISDEECVEALVPTRTNTDWQVALSELLYIRQNRVELNVDGAMKRHVNEWFTLLGFSDLFVGTRSQIRLSEIALNDLNRLERLCDFHEDPGTFWLAEGDNSIGWWQSWFSHFGSPDIESQWLMPIVSSEYLEQNYPNGIETTEDDREWSDTREWEALISLQPYMTNNGRQFQQPIFDPGNAQRSIRGQERRNSSTLLHNELVALVARKLRSGGYDVMEDPLSVDLLATRGNEETIVEVKTVTPRSLPPRMRLGVGQLSEYRYRRQIQTGSRPQGVLVLSSSTNFPEWLVRYFADDIRVALVSLQGRDILRAHTTGPIEDLLTMF